MISRNDKVLILTPAVNVYRLSHHSLLNWLFTVLNALRLSFTSTKCVRRRDWSFDRLQELRQKVFHAVG